MIKSLALVGCLSAVLSAFPLYAQSQSAPMVTLHKSLVSVGAKAGFNSSMFFSDELSVDNKRVENIQNNYKVGYFATLFCRFNLKKHHFIQPELSYNVSKGSISIPYTLANFEIIPESALIKTTISSFDLPILYGYKFIDVSPYGMAFFVGPKVAYIWDKQTKNEYSGFYQQDIHETFRRWNYSAVVGLAVNVSNIFFDFRYEVGLHNMTKSVTYNRSLTESPYNEGKIQIERRRNILSFSVGLIF